MTTEMKDDKACIKYRVMSVKQTAAPDELTEGNWYRYVK